MGDLKSYWYGIFLIHKTAEFLQIFKQPDF